MVRRQVLPAYWFGDWHWASAHVLCLLGALLGSIGSFAWQAHANSITVGGAPTWLVSSGLMLHRTRCSLSYVHCHAPLHSNLCSDAAMKWGEGQCWRLCFPLQLGLYLILLPSLGAVLLPLCIIVPAHIIR